VGPFVVKGPGEPKGVSPVAHAHNARNAHAHKLANTQR
jgi:hypothetical protein